MRRAIAKPPTFFRDGVAPRIPLFLALMCVSSVTAADESETEAAGDDGNTVVASDMRFFELRVVGPDRQPVARARVEIRTNPNPTADQILIGEFVKLGPYGTFAKTDAAGRLRVVRPSAPRRFNVSITTPGYGPYWAGWSSETHPEPIPAQFIAELETGWSVGGIVLDDEGKPVEGVHVRPSIEFKKRPGDVSQLRVGTNLTTDAQGKWRFDSIPASKGEVFVEISHPKFLPLRRALPRSEFAVENEREPSAKLVLNPGLSVLGVISDEQGNPISGALVRTKFLNDIREATSDKDGVYCLVGCEPVTARIVVSAKGRALDMKEVRISPTMDPVDFELRPGGHVRIRVLDERGEPVAKARIFFQRWRGHIKYFEFNHVDQYADENGIWEWNEAPLDEFEADICRPDGMELSQQPLIAREEEYVFRPPPPLVVSGKVIDAATKQPIGKFRVVPGVRSSPAQMNWVRSQQFTATDGKYSLRETHDYFAHLVRIEADGYQPAVSRDIKSGEGQVTIDFALKKGENVTAELLTPDGLPASGAQVALGVAGSQIIVKNGRIDDGSTYCAREDADDSGVFKFPPQDGEFQLVITHPSGYGRLKATAETMPGTIILEAWARVEGTFRVGKNPAAGVPITIMSELISSYGDGVPHISTQQQATSGQDGTFVFERILPGRARIGRDLKLHVDGALQAASSCLLTAKFTAGATTLIDLGGGGRSVVGKLRPAARFRGTVNWGFALIDVTPHADDRLGDGEDVLHCTATVDGEGNFRLDDLPAGDYTLSVRFNRQSAGQLFGYRFSVPRTNAASEEPVDLGDLMLNPE